MLCLYPRRGDRAYAGGVQFCGGDTAGQLRPYEARILCRETDIRFVQQQCLLTEMLRKWYNHPNRVPWEQPQDVPEAAPLL